MYCYFLVIQLDNFVKVAPVTGCGCTVIGTIVPFIMITFACTFKTHTKCIQDFCYVEVHMPHTCMHSFYYPFPKISLVFSFPITRQINSAKTAGMWNAAVKKTFYYQVHDLKKTALETLTLQVHALFSVFSAWIELCQHYFAGCYSHRHRSSWRIDLYKLSLTQLHQFFCA